jgi:uncharacterized membrane protein
MSSANPDIDGEREDTLSFERIVFFSDAVFAIAITLLAIEIRPPEVEIGATVNVSALIVALWPRVLAFLLSFLIIGVSWISHHRLFRLFKRYDYRMVLLNLLCLMFVAFLPVPTALLGRYGLDRSVVIFYAAVEGASWLAQLSLWLYASYHHRLLDPALDAATIRENTLRLLYAALIFLISIPLTFISLVATVVSWSVLSVLVPVVMRWLSGGSRGAA